VIRGHNFKGSITVEFPRRGVTEARVDPIGAKLRPTPHGFAVTVPADAGSGRIWLTNAAGRRSNLYGPITVLPGPVAQVVALPSGNSPFDGAGMWIWYLSGAAGGNPTAIAAQAKAAGIRTLYIKSSDGPTSFWSQFTPAMVQTFHALGLNVCAWQYVYGKNPVGEAAMGAEAVADGADCLVIDAESEYEGNYWAAQTYIEDLRAAIGPAYPVGLTSFPYTNVHPTEPYSVFFGPDGAQYDVPQVYWQDLGTTPDAAYAQTYIENRIYNRPIVPIGQSYNGVPTSAITRFRQLTTAYGAVGFSLWSWSTTTTASWAALEAPLAPGAAVTIPTTWPYLQQGSSGDQVIWMQEHLAAAEPSTSTDGKFDAATENALLLFQQAHGLPRSGVTDAATWAALLSLPPASVTYPQPPPTGSTGPSGSTGSSGSSGTSGSSGPSGPSGSSGASSGGTSP
jgi:uncharacterized membrane protein YgcG